MICDVVEPPLGWMCTLVIVLKHCSLKHLIAVCPFYRQTLKDFSPIRFVPMKYCHWQYMVDMLISVQVHVTEGYVVTEVML